ncbi:MAG TPA: glycosyltransferase family protein [Caulobacteraceae bacterium]|nr:glycosyltransferase family protein [Caulobacteraceae bacterium]
MILAILQARMSSTRLPGKVMAEVAGAPMIARQIERVRRARRIDHIVLATSTDPSDDPLAEHVATLGAGVYRGSLNDVLARFVGALNAFGPAEQVVRLTGDCPLADPKVIDATIALHLERGTDYAANTPAHRTFPKGLDVEVVRASCLTRAGREAGDPYEREHVTPYFYRHPERFPQAFLSQAAEEGELRWTVDRPDDLELVRTVYDALYPSRPDFTSDDVRAFLRSRPDLAMFGGDRRI